MIKRFNGLGSKLAQDVYLQSGIRPSKVQRRRKNAVTHKSTSYNYFISKGKDEVSVCRTAFHNLHGENEGRIKRLAGLKSENAAPTDGRGKHHNRPNAYSDEKLNLIEDHIKSFPRYQTHYNSKITYYLASGLSVAKMHRLFLGKHFPCCLEMVTKNGCDQDKVCCIPIHVYRNYYIENFNYKFGRPKTDVCNQCEELNCLLKTKTLPNEIKAVENRLKLHKTMANAFYSNLNKTQERVEKEPNVECLVFDFMQHVPVPHLPVNEVFYLRQMWVYTFGIHHYFKGGNKDYFFMWAECDAKHGANEVISCLKHFIETKVGEQCDTLVLFSDGCTGQNRNHTMVRYLMTLVNSSRFKSVQQFFPTRGHSFMPCDRDFAKLGRLKKKKERAAVPGEWVELFSERNNVITFPEITFYDFTTHFAPFFKKAVKSQGDTFTITKYKRILYTKGKNCVSVSMTSNSNVWIAFNLLKRDCSFTDSRLTKPKMPEDRLYRYPFSVAVKPEKIKDIKKLYQYLSPEEVAYFDCVKVAVEPDEEANM